MALRGSGHAWSMVLLVALVPGVDAGPVGPPGSDVDDVGHRTVAVDAILQTTQAALAQVVNDTDALLVGAPSVPAGAVLPNPPPENLRATKGPSSVFLAWDAPDAPDLLGFYVYRIDLPATLSGALGSQVGLPPTRIATLGATTTSYEDTGVDLADERYVYYVTARYPQITSPPTTGPLSPWQPSMASQSSMSTSNDDDESAPTFSLACQILEVNAPDNTDPAYELNMDCLAWMTGGG